MRTLLFLLMSSGAFLLPSPETQAFIYSFGGEKITLVEDLPETAEWQTDTGYADLCVIYEQFCIMWVPLWNSNARYVLGNEHSDTYYEFADYRDRLAIASERGEASGAIPYWDRIGGKLVLGLILLGAVGIKALSPYVHARAPALPVTLRDRDPDPAAAHHHLGAAFGSQGEAGEAIASLRRATALDPGDAVAHFNLGVALGQQGKTGEAVGSYRRAIGLDPGYAEAHTYLGCELEMQGEHDEAIAHLRRAIGLDPESPKAHFNLGAALGNQGNLEEAIGSFRNAIGLDPDNAEAHFNLAVALGEQGKTGEAMRSYRRAAELEPRLAGALDGSIELAQKWLGESPTGD